MEQWDQLWDGAVSSKVPVLGFYEGKAKMPSTEVASLWDSFPLAPGCPAILARGHLLSARSKIPTFKQSFEQSFICSQGKGQVDLINVPILQMSKLGCSEVKTSARPLQGVKDEAETGIFLSNIQGGGCH